MRVWTVQPLDAYEVLMKNNILTCNPLLSENIQDFHFGEAYNWLIKEMTSKIGPPPKGVEYPIWAWHTMNWKHKKPDLRESGYLARGQKAVLLELEIPDDQVVLSDFDAWHFVLNKWYYSDAKNEEESDKADAEFEALPENEKQVALENSWKNIFDITPFENDWTVKGRYVQATFWELKTEYIKKTQFFTAR